MQSESLIIYIHGFLSAPTSKKAQLMKESLAQQCFKHQYIVPQLPCYPTQAAEYLWELLATKSVASDVYLIGSSLGGYYGIWLRERLIAEKTDIGCVKLVAINPAIKPYELLCNYLGDNVNPYTEERFTLTEQHIAELKALKVSQLSHPEDCLLMVQTADDVLDYRQAVNYFQSSPQVIEPGGSHHFDHFEQHLEKIYDFFGVLPPVDHNRG
ncbi:esterase [Zooshikella marina]|uniref:YqiA/YcfP family alpha/beta fold hydrolase n=1 Tax=Zooshikella ganghwensis TaxID=202772 RepID=UPI001BB03E9C|nr:YqiA/YcfP family alpha/beta fold hydrolase [Zooshikella ganghwensis]MBU2706222.1 esterase [Zooshikella ganghwensis]